MLKKPVLVTGGTKLAELAWDEVGTTLLSVETAASITKLAADEVTPQTWSDRL